MAIKHTVHTYIRHIAFMILLSKQQKSQVQATQMRVLRRIEGVQSRQGDRCGHKVEAGPGRYSRCSKEKTGEVEETGIKK